LHVDIFGQCGERQLLVGVSNLVLITVAQHLEPVPLADTTGSDSFNLGRAHGVLYLVNFITK
jgi:hypothetical protein